MTLESPIVQGKPLFLADWHHAVFIHYRIDPQILAPHIPFELDTFDGNAYVSLVAFTQRNLRLASAGRVAAWLAGPLARHEFLNLRTYVRVGDTRGIYFLAEWIPNRLATLIGPRLYGLPYRLGTLRYRNDWADGIASGRVSAGEASFDYRATFDFTHFGAARRDPLTHFLIERYAAFTSRQGVHRRFDVQHAPWPFAHAQPAIHCTTLPASVAPWFDRAELACAHASIGVNDVGISAPQIVSPDQCCIPVSPAAQN